MVLLWILVTLISVASASGPSRDGTPVTAMLSQSQATICVDLLASAQARFEPPPRATPPSEEIITIPSAGVVVVRSQPLHGIQLPGGSATPIRRLIGSIEMRMSFIVFGLRSRGRRQALPEPRTPLEYTFTPAERVGDTVATRGGLPRGIQISREPASQRAQEWLATQPEFAQGRVFHIKEIDGKEGGVQDVFFATRSAAPEGLSRAELRQWVLENAERVIKIRKDLEVDSRTEEILDRDLVLHGLGEELTAAARLNGEAFIRMARIESTAVQHSTGLINMEMVRGPSAYELTDAVEEYYHRRRVGGNLGPRARRVLEQAGIDLRAADIETQMDLMRQRIDGLAEWYADTTPIVREFSVSNGVALVGNFWAGRRRERTAQSVVGMDPLYGHNALWSVVEQKWILVDW